MTKYVATDSFNLSGSGTYEKGQAVNQPEPVLKDLLKRGLIVAAGAKAAVKVPTKKPDAGKSITVPANKAKKAAPENKASAEAARAARKASKATE